MSTTARTLVVLQPGYLPWLGFFDQLRRADVFAYYDDVQFDKHGWRNRNRIKTPAGSLWLTVPVLHHGRNQPRIDEVQIDNHSNWQRKHIATLKQYYGKAPHASRYLPQLEEILGRPWTRLAELDIAVAGVMAEWLGLEPPTIRSSTLGVEGAQSQRLVNLCLHFGATRYLSGNSASEYLDLALFASHGIEVSWQDYTHPVYPQQSQPFVPFLSAIDLLFNCGDQSPEILKSGSPE